MSVVCVVLCSLPVWKCEVVDDRRLSNMICSFTASNGFREREIGYCIIGYKKGTEMQLGEIIINLIYMFFIYLFLLYIQNKSESE